MLVNNGGNTLTVQNITLDGTCSAGSRSAGVWSTTGGTTTVVKNTALHDFTGSGNTAVEVSNGTLVVEGNTFANNQTAMEGTGGTLYAFANNVTTNNGTNAATGVTDGVDNVKCNYWGSASIDNSAQFAERLGSPVSSYVEGPGALSLGQASLAAATSGNQVLINLGRSTSNPPFNNGTTSGLGALASDFFAACLSRDGSGVGAISVTADSVTPGTAGFRLYEITDVLDCSPSTNTACWDYDGASGTTPGATLTDPSPSEGHFVIGNQMDPTVITLRSLTAESDNGPIWALLIGVMFATIALLVGRAVLYRRQR